MAKITIKDSEISSSANIHFSGSISGPAASFTSMTNVTSISATTLSGTTGQFGVLTASNSYVSDKLGIGTTSPTHKVHINSTDDNAYALRVQGNTTNVNGVWTGIGIGGENANTKAAILFQDIGVSFSRGKLHLAVNNEVNQNSATPTDAKLTISNDGNVGIGVTSPTYKLHINGTLGVSGNTTLVGNLTVDTNTLFVDSSNNRVGIGTTSPASRLTISTSSVDANSDPPTLDVFGPWIRIGDGGGSLTYTNGTGIKFHNAGVAHYSIGELGGKLLFSQTSGNGAQLFPSGKTDIMALASDGKVGIGTTTPNYTLSVTGTLGVSGNTTLTTISGTTAQFTSITGSFSGNGSNITNLNYSNISNPPTIGNATITISAGNGLTTGGSFTTNQTGAGTITLNVGAGTGISVAADTVSIDTSVVPRLGVNNTFTGTNTFSVLTASNVLVDTITAREFYTQLVTASVLYESGSTKFGDTQDDLHQFTGSIDVTGSVRTSNLIISQDVGSTVQPQIQFIGSASNPITLKVLDDNSLSFRNSSGNEVFHIDADLTGTIFSVTDGSGIPSIEVEDTGDITLAEFGGNVGVGTGSPAYKLDVSGTMRVTGASQFASVSGTLAQFNSLTVLNGSTSLASVSGTVGEFTEITASNLRINSNSLLVGDAEITGLIKHGINSIDLFGSGDDMVFKAGYTQSDFNFTNTSNTSLMYVSQSGNVGIGTTSPSARLHISGSQIIRASTDNQDPILEIQEYRGPAIAKFYELNDAGLLKLGYYGITTSNLTLNGGTSNLGGSISGQHNSSTGFLITSNTSSNSYILSNVGIGTTSPLWKLHLSGASSSNSGPHIVATTNQDLHPVVQHLNYSHDNIAINFDSYYDGTWKSSDAGSNFQIYKVSDALNFRYDNGKTAGSTLAWSNGITLSNTGLVGIGTSSPSAKLDLLLSNTYDGITLRGNTVPRIVFDNNTGLTDKWGIGINATNGNRFGIGKNATGHAFTNDYFVIDENGNVGIGTTSPSANLEVSGSTIFGKLLTHTHQFTGSIDITGSARTSNLIISPDAGSTVQPKITYIGSSSNPIELKVLDDNTLSWEGSAGQLFSIANNLTGGVIFSVGDVSGIPLIEADASGTVAMARFGTQVGIGTNQTTDTLTVSGGVDITGSFSIDGFSTSWGVTTDVQNKGINVRLGTASSATWLITGTSNGTFRGGIQQLDGGNGARWYTNSISQYASLASSGLSLAVGSFTSPGNFFASNGSQTAPSFTFSGDNNTGMFLGTTDELAFTTAGSERLRINSTGLVCIGTTTAYGTGGNAQVSIAIPDTLNANILSAGPSNTNLFYIRYQSAGKYAWQTYNGSNTGEIQLQPYGGNVGIGTTSPQAKLDINSNSTSVPALLLRNGDNLSSFTKTQIVFGYGNTNQYNHFVHTRHNGSAATNNAIDFYVCDSTQNNTLTSGVIHNLTLNGGDVGIGTTTPTHKLNVVGDVGIGATANTSTNYMLDIASTKGSGNFGAVRVKAPTVGGSLTNTEVRMLSDVGGWRAVYAKQGSATSAIYADGTSHFTGSVQVTGNVDISGTLTATAKSFDIEHPTKEGMRLRYGSLEGPENGVYVRGIITSSVIDLPDYWTGLVDEDSITVNLTPVGGPQEVWVEDIRDNKVILGGEVNKCYYMVLGERKDIDKLVVEY